MISQPDALERAALAQTLAPARPRPYRSVFGGDTNSALSLYVLEMELVAAMQQIVAAVEVLLREQMHRGLTAAYGAKWYVTQWSELDDRTRVQVSKALRHLGTNPPPGKVVAEMDFGSWTYLLEAGGLIAEGTVTERRADYETYLWQPALVTAFPNAGAASRNDIGLLARRARWARNRMAHRESVLFGFPQPGQRDASGTLIRQTPASLLEDVRVLAGFIDTDVGKWLRRCDAPDKLLATQAAHDALTFAQNDLYKRRTWI